MQSAPSFFGHLAPVMANLADNRTEFARFFQSLNRFTGAAQSVEAELVAHYKGIELVEERDRHGALKYDEFGRVKKKQRGDSLLYREFGVRKQQETTKEPVRGEVRKERVEVEGETDDEEHQHGSSS